MPISPADPPSRSVTFEESGHYLKRVSDAYLNEQAASDAHLDSVRKQHEKDLKQLKTEWKSQLSRIEAALSQLQDERTTWLKEAERELATLDHKESDAEKRQRMQHAERLQQRYRSAMRAESALISARLEKEKLQSTVARLNAELRPLVEAQTQIAERTLADMDCAIADYCNRHKDRNKAVSQMGQIITQSLGDALAEFCKLKGFNHTEEVVVPFDIGRILKDLDTASDSGSAQTILQRELQLTRTAMTDAVIASAYQRSDQLLPMALRTLTTCLNVAALCSMVTMTMVMIWKSNALSDQESKHIANLDIQKSEEPEYPFDPQEPFYHSTLSHQQLPVYLALYQARIKQWALNMGKTLAEVYAQFRQHYDTETMTFAEPWYREFFPLPLFYTIGAPSHSDNGTALHKKLMDLAWCAVRGIFDTTECPADIEGPFHLRLVQDSGVLANIPPEHLRTWRDLMPAFILLTNRLGLKDEFDAKRCTVMNQCIQTGCVIVISWAAATLGFKWAKGWIRQAQHTQLNNRYADALAQPSVTAHYKRFTDAQTRARQARETLLTRSLGHSIADDLANYIEQHHDDFKGKPIQSKQLLDERTRIRWRESLSSSPHIEMTQRLLTEAQDLLATLQQQESAAAVRASQCHDELNKWVAAASKQQSRQREANAQRTSRLDDMELKLRSFDERQAMLTIQQSVYTEAAAQDIQRQQDENETALNRVEAQLKQQLQNHPIHHLFDLSHHINAVMTPAAWELVRERHIEIPDADLVSRVETGRFVNATGETVNSMASRASSYFSFAHAVSAMGDAAIAAARHPSTGLPGAASPVAQSSFRITVEHGRPMGRTALWSNLGDITVRDSSTSQASFVVSEGGDIRITHLYPS